MPINTPLRSLLLIQLLATLAILAFVPTNSAKLLGLLAVWLLTFGKLKVPELILYISACAFFTIMNILSLKQGIFAFSQPDVLGMPIYEFFMWGYYLLHTIRMVGGCAPTGNKATSWVLAVLFAITFSAISDPQILLLTSALLLGVALVFFHEPLDLTYLGYMVFLGAAIEYSGVWSGQWHYPGNPPGGVPLWFITLWGGVGLFLRRLVAPILSRFMPIARVAASV